jgi:hypothetical protein
MRDTALFLCALQRHRCVGRGYISREYHRNRVHPRAPLGITHAWGPF